MRTGLFIAACLTVASAPAVAQTGHTTTTSNGTVTSTTTVTHDASSWSNAPGANALLASMHGDAHAMGLLHRSNLAEIDAATLAERRAHDADVKAFAAQMARDHADLDRQGTALAARLNLVPTLPDSTLPNMAAEELHMLRATERPLRTGALGGPDRPIGRNPAPVDTAGIPGGVSGAPMTRADRGAVTASAGGSVGTDAAGVPLGAKHDADEAAGLRFDVNYVTSQVNDHERTLAIIDAAIAQTQSAELKTALQTQVRPVVASHLRMAQQIVAKLGTR